MNVFKLQKTWDWILILIINFMWATQVPVIRMMGDSLGPITIAFIPMIISMLLFIPVLLIENRKRNTPFRWRWRDQKYFVVAGGIGIFLMQYMYTLGSQKTLAANAGIITLTTPVIVAILASFMLREKLNFVRVAGFSLAIAGVLLTSLSDIGGANFMESGYLYGNLIFMFACCCCGFYNTFCKMLVEKKYTELEILVYGSLVGSILSIPLLLWVEPFSLSKILHAGNTVIYGLLELSLFVYGLSMLLFFYVLKRMDVTQAILGNYLLPFFIGLLGVFLLHEKITLVMVAGGSIILVSTLMVTVYEKQLLTLSGKRAAKK